jgi:diacylglycerol kinase family enzyme
MAVTRRSRLGLCALLPAFYSGAAHAARGIVLLDATRINVRADIPCDLEFDGDPHGRLPAAIQIRPRCIELVCRA